VAARYVPHLCSLGVFSRGLWGGDALLPSNKVKKGFGKQSPRMQQDWSLSAPGKGGVGLVVSRERHAAQY
jgi:hypothetical protein